jgi:hypothetical protein
MRDWQQAPMLADKERTHVLEAIQFFRHTTSMDALTLAGVDGSGDFPCLTYADSFIYVTVAEGTVYKSNPTSGLKEDSPKFSPPPEFTWLPDDKVKSREKWRESFERLAGDTIENVVGDSDYRVLKASASGKNSSVERLVDELICPHASDSGNIGIQLRTTAELGLALQVIKSDAQPDFVLVDTTMSLPLVTRRDASLFYEHVKRLCCVEAHSRGIGFFALSKSHGLPAIELIEDVAKEKSGKEEGQPAEHWFLRIPTTEIDGWELTQTNDRQLPPIGAITYLVRFHRNVPVMRLDMDVHYWQSQVRNSDAAQQRANEAAIFERLDYASHDQRAYGYPYPLKSGHDRASLTSTERASYRRQIIDAALAIGMKRSIFRDASMATGHK